MSNVLYAVVGVFQEFSSALDTELVEIVDGAGSGVLAEEVTELCGGVSGFLSVCFECLWIGYLFTHEIHGCLYAVTGVTISVIQRIFVQADEDFDQGEGELEVGVFGVSMVECVENSVEVSLEVFVCGATYDGSLSRKRGPCQQRFRSRVFELYPELTAGAFGEWRVSVGGRRWYESGLLRF